jgi:hypothetical protein
MIANGFGQLPGLVAVLQIRQTIDWIRYDNERRCSIGSKNLSLVSRCRLVAVLY